MNYEILRYGLVKTCVIVGLALIFSVGLAVFISGIKTLIRGTRSTRSKHYFVVWTVQFLVATAPFASLAIVAGFLTGVSRVPVVAALIPAILTLLGSLGVYLFATGHRMAIIATSSIFCFSALLLFGTIVGSLERELYEVRQNSLEKKMRDVDIEFSVRQYRKGLGLPLDVPLEKSKAAMQQ
jgi:hypothetical protein